MDGNGELVPASNGSNGIGAASRKFTHVRATDFYGDTGNFTGDVVVGGGLTVGGVLTYEDVTNIDSIGIITARSDIKVGSGVTITPAGAGFYAGIVTATNFVKRDGSSLGGVASDGQENTVGGTNAGNALTSNSISNTLFGSQSGRIVDTGDRNTAIGRYTLYSATSSSDNVAIGYNSLYATIANNNTAIGSYAGRNISSGADNTILGKSAGDQLTTSSHNVIIGSDAGKGANQSTASRNVIIGYQAIQNQDNPSDQVAIGYRAMANQKDDAYGNVAIGSYALECATNQEVYNNTCIGMNAGQTAENGFGQSVFVGYSAGQYINGPDYCTGIGFNAMRGNSGNKLTGYHNTGCGYRSLAIVQGAGEKNTALGSEAGDTITTGSNNICIGYNAQASSATVLNEITLGDTNISKFRIPGIQFEINQEKVTTQGLDTNGMLKEHTQIVSGKLSDNVNINTSVGNVYHFTTQETTTSTPNIRFDGVAGSFNSNVDIGDTVSVTIITTAAAAAYSANLNIDGSSVTVNWVGGSAPSAGGSSGVDIYTYNIIKTANNTFTVIGNLTKTS